VQANPVISSYHDRMPAILLSRDDDEWPDRGEVDDTLATLRRDLDALNQLRQAAQQQIDTLTLDESL
jgi:putative SOS response-associated peptidase YedK